MVESRSRLMFLAIEVNLLLWIAAAIATRGNGVVLLGLAVAAVLQHWAYYVVYRPKRR
jgi:hypothetical protein